MKIATIIVGKIFCRFVANVISFIIMKIINLIAKAAFREHHILFQ